MPFTKQKTTTPPRSRIETSHPAYYPLSYPARMSPSPKKPKRPKEPPLVRTATLGRKRRIAKITLPGKGKRTVEKEVRQFKMGGGDICGAEKHSGDPCQLAAGWGTPHPGVGRCKWHGGLNPVAIRRSMAKEMEHLLGFEMEMDPHTALLWAIRITAGEIHWLSLQMSFLKREEWLEHTIAGRKLHTFARARAEAIERLAKYSKWAIDAGLEERRVRIAELYGNALGRLIKGLLDDLQLTRQQREDAPLIVRKHLALLEARNVSTQYEDVSLLGGEDPDDPIVVEAIEEHQNSSQPA